MLTSNDYVISTLKGAMNLRRAPNKPVRLFYYVPQILGVTADTSKSWSKMEFTNWNLPLIDNWHFKLAWHLYNAKAEMLEQGETKFLPTNRSKECDGSIYPANFAMPMPICRKNGIQTLGVAIPLPVIKNQCELSIIETWRADSAYSGKANHRCFTRRLLFPILPLSKKEIATRTTEYLDYGYRSSGGREHTWQLQGHLSTRLPEETRPRNNRLSHQAIIIPAKTVPVIYSLNDNFIFTGYEGSSIAIVNAVNRQNRAMNLPPMLTGGLLDLLNSANIYLKQYIAAQANAYPNPASLPEMNHNGLGSCIFGWQKPKIVAGQMAAPETIHVGQHSKFLHWPSRYDIEEKSFTIEIPKGD